MKKTLRYGSFYMITTVLQLYMFRAPNEPNGSRQNKADDGLKWAVHMAEIHRIAEMTMLDEIVYA